MKEFLSSLCGIFVNLLIYNSYFVNFIFNWNSWDGSIGASALLLPIEIAYIVSFIIGFTKKKKKLVIANFVILLFLIFVIIFNRLIRVN